MAKCEKCSCDSTDADVFHFPAYAEEDEFDAVLCPECGAEAGFCVVCGWLVAGSGDENWRNTGACFQCCQELDEEMMTQ